MKIKFLRKDRDSQLFVHHESKDAHLCRTSLVEFDSTLLKLACLQVDSRGSPGTELELVDDIEFSKRQTNLCRTEIRRDSRRSNTSTLARPADLAVKTSGGTLLSGGVGTVLGTLFGVAIQGLIQTYINFDGTLSSWWTKIAIGILLFIFIALQRGLTVLWENRQSSPVTRVNIAQQ